MGQYQHMVQKPVAVFRVAEFCLRVDFLSQLSLVTGTYGAETNWRGMAVTWKGMNTSVRLNS